jgi:predicted acetyltransferase
MTDIATPGEEHREQVAHVMRVSLNLSHAFLEHTAPSLPLDQFRCAIDGGRVVATAAARDYVQWFGGRELDMSGIWAVATLPEHRGTGLATGAVSRLLHEARERGFAISALYPATLRPYRGLGYELAGTFTEHEVRLDDLPRGAAGPLEVREYDPSDLDAVRACYRCAIAHHNGPIDSDDPQWWPVRIMGHRTPEELHRAVVAVGIDGAIEGYASFVNEKAEGELDISFVLACKQFVASTLEAYASLLGYFRSFRGLGQTLRFTGPPTEPLTMLVEEQRVKPAWTYRWMLRLLDVPKALEARGYPRVSGEGVIAVEDGHFPGNHGPWRVVAKDGEVRVEPADGARVRPIQVGTLASMFSGYLSPFDAVRLGLLDGDDPSVPLLARLFSGPAPFILDFF